jgi:type III restriction enzyme
VKNQGLGFAMPYFHNGQSHDYIPDFIIRLDTDGGESYLILETKGFDEIESIKRAAAERWIHAVNVDQRFGHWQYAVAKKPEEVRNCLDNARKR